MTVKSKSQIALDAACEAVEHAARKYAQSPAYQALMKARHAREIAANSGSARPIDAGRGFDTLRGVR